MDENNYYDTLESTKKPLFSKTIILASIVFVLVAAISSGIFYYQKNKHKKAAEVLPGESIISLLPEPTKSESPTSQNAVSPAPVSAKSQNVAESNKNKSTNVISDEISPSAQASGEKTSTSTFEDENFSSAAASASSNGSVSTSTGPGFAAASASSN